jgi:putative endonuclease
MIPPPAGGGAPSLQTSYVYLLQSEADGTCYVGWTTHVARRLVEHNRGEVPWSRRKIPWRLIGFELHATPALAKRRERALKRNPRMLALFRKRVLNRAAIGRPQQVVG